MSFSFHNQQSYCAICHPWPYSPGDSYNAPGVHTTCFPMIQVRSDEHHQPLASYYTNIMWKMPPTINALSSFSIISLPQVREALSWLLPCPSHQCLFFIFQVLPSWLPRGPIGQQFGYMKLKSCHIVWLLAK